MERSARASFDWLQEGGPASPLRLQISVSARIVPKLQAQIKKGGAVQVGIISRSFYTYIHNKSFETCDSLFFYTHRLVSTRPIRFGSSLNCCFRLQITVHRLAVLLTVFWRKKRGLKCKRGKMEVHTNADHIYLVSA